MHTQPTVIAKIHIHKPFLMKEKCTSRSDEC